MEQKTLEKIKKENSQIFDEYAYDGAGVFPLIEQMLNSLRKTHPDQENYYAQARILYDDFELASDDMTNIEYSINSLLILDAITQHQNKVLASLYNETKKYITWAEEHPDEVLLNEPEYTEFWDLMKKVKEKSKNFIIMSDPKEFF